MVAKKLPYIRIGGLGLFLISSWLLGDPRHLEMAMLQLHWQLGKEPHGQEIYTLPETNRLPMKKYLPKRKQESIPTIIFSRFELLVSGGVPNIFQ